MKKYYFTFGLGHKLGEFYQVIFADSEVEANQKMIELYDNKWAFCYTHEQWSMSKLEGFFQDLLPLEPVYVKVELV